MISTSTPSVAQAATPQEMELISRLAARDETVMALFYERYGAMLYRVILRLVKHSLIAENVLKESLVTIWYASHTYDATQNRLFSWALGICRDRAMQEMRSCQNSVA